jgi:hypothetical protein
MKISLNTIKKASLGIVLAFLLGGCSGGSSETSSGGGESSDTSLDGGSNSVTSSSDPLGTLSIYLTDAPTDEVSSVNVYITGLTIKRSGASVERFSNDVGLIDLLDLRDSTLLIAEDNVTAGDYEFIRVGLDQSRSNVIVSGETLPLKIPSEEIKVLGGFVVRTGGSTNIVLDFDADKSLVKLGDGNWLLKPVIVKK